MAEYSREQRNQLSRAITNSEAKSRQLKGFVDNRIIQRKAEAENKYEEMQKTHGGGNRHGKRTTVPKERIESQREDSITDLFERFKTQEEERTGETLSEERTAQLKSK